MSILDHATDSLYIDQANEIRKLREENLKLRQQLAISQDYAKQLERTICSADDFIGDDGT